MPRQIHIAPLHRIGMNIIQLFPYHRFAKNQLGMQAFLPKLKLPVMLVSALAGLSDGVTASASFDAVCSGRWSVRSVGTIEFPSAVVCYALLNTTLKSTICSGNKTPILPVL